MGYDIDVLPVGEGEKSGDAIALRFGNLYGKRDEQTIVVIDGGFKESGERLVQHIKKYYKTDRLDLVVSTHPDTDHAAGLEVVLKQLKVDCLWMHRPWNHTEDIANMFQDDRVTESSLRRALRESLDSARTLERLAQAKGVPIEEPFAGMRDASGQFYVVGPSEAFYESLLPQFCGTPEPKQAVSFLERVAEGARELAQRVAEHWDYETLSDEGETSPENNSSAILLLEHKGRTLLFTADAGAPALTDVADLIEDDGFDSSSLNFVQVPHHGSKRNVGPSILDRIIGPKQKEDKRLKTAYVSAAKDGAPKHPAKKVTNAFRRRGAPVYATQGRPIWHHHDAPDRADYTAIEPLPFYNEVED